MVTPIIFLPDSIRRIADARRAAESELKGAIAAVPDSETVEDYLPAFRGFALSLFDAEAAEALEVTQDKKTYESFLEHDLSTRIIEGILPDQGLARLRATWSREVNSLSVEQEIGSEIIFECRPDGTTQPARDEIQAAHAQHGDWEKFTPDGVRFRLRLGKSASVREELRQVLKRRRFYWLGRLSLRPGRLTPQTDMDSLMTETRVDKRKLDEAQQQRLDDAAREMNESFRAYGRMRDLVVDPEWKPAGPPSPDAPTMLEEISTLERDIRLIAIKTVRVYAEASWSLGSVGPFRIRLQSDANDILRWIFALVNKKMSKEDIPLLPWDAIEQAVHQEVANQIRRAEREWDVSPPWRTLDPELAALPGSGSATNVPEKPDKPASPLVRVASSEGIAPSATEPQAIEERAARRQAVVNPILHQKRWKPGRLATAAGVGKNSVYEYLDGTRAKITDENRNAIAQALDLKPEDLPD